MKREFLEKKRLINTIIKISAEVPDLSIMKLDKLLFLFDLEVFKATGFTATGLTYFTEKNGPAPKDLNKSILSNDRTLFGNSVDFEANNDYREPLKVKTFGEFEGDFFSDIQEDLLNKVIFDYGQKTGQELSDITHLTGSVYDKTLQANGLDQPIDLSLELSQTQAEFVREELLGFGE